MAKGRYKHEIPLNLTAPLPECAKSKPVVAPEPRPSPHEPGCWCVRCYNTGVDIGIQLENKRLSEL